MSDWMWCLLGVIVGHILTILTIVIYHKPDGK